MKLWHFILDHMPMWFRFRWPLRRYYVQPADAAEAEQQIDYLRKTMDHY